MTPRRVFIRPIALDDIDECVERIAASNLAAAIEFDQQVQATLQALAEHPETGRLAGFPRAAELNVRQRPVAGQPNYLIFYRPMNGGIEVVRFLHGARDIPNVLHPSES